MGEIEATFVSSQPDPRPQIWAEFMTASAALARVCHVSAAWVGGSFFSDQAMPDDIDCVYIVDDRTKPTTAAEAALFDLFVGGRRLRSVTGLRVDSYVLPWVYRPGVALDLASQVPLMERGYWDDLWQRRRHGPKATVHPEDALPKRGYLEVISGGFAATPP